MKEHEDLANAVMTQESQAGGRKISAGSVYPPRLARPLTVLLSALAIVEALSCLLQGAQQARFTQVSQGSAQGEFPRTRYLVLEKRPHTLTSGSPEEGVAEHPHPELRAQRQALCFQEDAAGEGAGFGAVAGALGGRAAQQPGEAPAECRQPANPERGEPTGI